MITDVTPDKIAFAGDWHMNGQWAKSAIRYAYQHGADTILHTGDFGYTFTRRYLDDVDSALSAYNMRLFFVDGNHENHEYLQQLPRSEDGTVEISSFITHLPRGYRWAWDHVRFLALGGAVSVDQRLRMEGVTWWRGEEISSGDAAQAILGGYADVVVSHDAPAGYDIPRLGRSDYWPEDLIRASNYNRELLARVAAVVRPSCWFHGHYHIPYSLTTTLGDAATRPVRVTGLDCDGTEFADNLAFHTLAELRAAKDIDGGGSPTDGQDREALLGSGEQRQRGGADREAPLGQG
jgi:hypothetical protein